MFVINNIIICDLPIPLGNTDTMLSKYLTLNWKPYDQRDTQYIGDHAKIIDRYFVSAPTSILKKDV